jgi:hypothetical protein
MKDFLQLVLWLKTVVVLADHAEAALQLHHLWWWWL